MHTCCHEHLNCFPDITCSHNSGLPYINFVKYAWQERGGISMKRQEAAILQLNIGLYCNQACSHCHVESSPKRFEMMDRPTAEQCVRLMQDGTGSVATVDITGGAPELNSQFK